MKDYATIEMRIGKKQMSDKQTALLGIFVLVMFCWIVKIFIEGM